ncbi:MAG: GNAT family N-acetyltransferase [Bradyrhizobium sp.]|uniref:GNAT family N-acetyltransferase n=1 Tax=Bradyrhizobium sp. TaxID=376 RepID=UPI0025BF321F|nr:GNAT family N-acetyltransferase [Bradyrhizobium sp.]MBI5263058.1 GNAT family N-acetyltransferase [Bradyrhizobium sp.]
MSEVRIREAGVADVDLITELVAASFKDVAERFELTEATAPSHPAFVTAAAITRAMDRGTLFLVAENPGERGACGCVGIRLPRQGICAMEKLAVLPQWRQHGIGSRLLEEMIARAAALGATQIEAALIAGHGALKQWYQTRGFGHQRTERFEHLPFLVDFLYRNV